MPVHELEMADDGTIYFTMKLVKGRSLAEILKATRDGEESHSVAELLQIFLKVCDGVAFAHSRGVIHRDLKPANIMVGDFGEVLVMDWGIAKILGADDIADEHVVGSSRQDMDQPELYTIAGKAMGSPAYMPPEQAAGDLDRIGPSSDIYSLGAILYEMLTLKRPLTGDTAKALLAKVGKEQITPPEQRAPERNIPRELSAVAMKCLSKNRRQRYQSVMGLQRDVNLYLEGRSVSAAPDTFAQAFVKLVKRNKAVSAAVTAAAVIVIALATVFIISLKAERDRAVASEQQAVTAQQEQRATALAASKRFAMQAIRAAETGRHDEAERRAKDAESVALDSPWGPYARGMFARRANDYAAAADLFRKALEADGDHAESKAALSEVLARTGDLAQAKKLLAGAGDVTDWRAMLKVGQTLYDTGRWRDCLVVFNRALELMEKAKDASKGLRVATAKEVQKKIIIARAKALCIGLADQIKGLAPDEQIKHVQAKFEEVNGAGMKIANVEIKNGEWIRASLPGNTRFLEQLRGLPLQSLTMVRTQVTDLEPLKGMPLTVLNCGATPVSDLTPLKGMPLTKLHCEGSKVSDLSPLKDMPLTYLNCMVTRISDLSPLKDMPLTSFGCADTKVTDLGPLEGMPLKILGVDGTKVTDLSPLAGMKLEEFSFTPKRITKGIEIIRGMKSIARIGPVWNRLMAPEEFWKKYDAGEFNK